MQLTAIGLNHHKTPIAIRERFALPKHQLKAGVLALKQEGVREVAILSTCNRTEIYCHTHDTRPVTQWLCEVGQMQESRLIPHLFIAPSREAIRHVYRVAAGLDSMVLGEANIVGQLKEAVKTAQAEQALGSTLHRLFQSAFSVAKEVRTHTDIGRHGVSMASVSLQLAETIFGDWAQTKIAFIGSGEMIQLCATHAATRRPEAMLFLSKDWHRALQLAQRFGGEAGLIGEVDQRLHEYDVVIACTDSTLPIIGAGMVQRAIKKRQHRPMMMVDLGVPRNIEPEANQQNDIFLYSVDDLHAIIESNLSNRKEASAKAQWLIEERVDDFLRYLDHRKAVSTIRQLQHGVHHAAEVEIDRALRQLARGSSHKKVLENLTHRLSRQWLHPWLAHLNSVEGEPFDQSLSIMQAALMHQRSPSPPSFLPALPSLGQSQTNKPSMP